MDSADPGAPVADTSDVAALRRQREVRRGYRLDDDLLRPAQVVVVASGEASDRWR